MKKDNRAVGSLLNKKEGPKKSILRRWSIANAVFFFVIINIVAFASYQIVIGTIMSSNKSATKSGLEQIVARLELSDQAITSANLEKYFDTSPITANGSAGPIVHPSDVVSQMIRTRNMGFFIYDDKKDLIFTTFNSPFPFHEDTAGKVISVNYNGSQGYVISQAVKSKVTGQTVAYVMTYSDMGTLLRFANNLFQWSVR